MALRTWNQTAIIKYLQTGGIRRGSNRSAKRPAYHQSKQQWPSSRYKNTNESEQSIHNIVTYSEYGGIHKELYPRNVKHILSRAEEIENLAKKARQYFERQNKSKAKYVWDREKRLKKDRPTNFSEVNLIKYYKDNYTNEILQPSKQPSFGSLDLRSVREIPKSHKIAIVSPNTRISSLKNSGIVKREMSSNPPDLTEIKVINSKSKGIKFDTKKTSLADVKISDENSECIPGSSEENCISCNKILNPNDDVVASDENNCAKDEEQTKDLLPAVDHGMPSFNAFIWEDITGMLRPRSVSMPKQEYVPMQEEVKKVDVAVDEEISKMHAKREARLKAAQVEKKQTPEKKKSPVVKTKPAKVKVPKPSKKVTRGFVVKEKAVHASKPISKPTPKTLTVDDLNKQINRLRKNQCLLDKLIKKTASTGKIAKKPKRTTSKVNVEPKANGPDLSLFNKIRSTSNVPNQKPRSAPRQIHFTIDIPQSGTAIVYKKRKYSTFSANVARLLQNDGILTTDLPRYMSQRINKSHFDGICESPETEYQDHSEPCHCVEPFRPSVLPKIHRLVKRYNTNMGGEQVPKECLPPCVTVARADDNIDLYKKKCLPNIRDTDCPCVEPSEYTRKVKLCRLTKCIPCPNQQQTCPDPCPKQIEKFETYIPKKCLPKLPDSPCLCVEPKRLSVMPKLCRLVKRCDDGPVAISPKCVKECKIERADDNVDLYKKKCLPDIEDSGCKEFCERPMKNVRLCRLIKKNVLASVGEIKDERCEPKCVSDVYVAKKKLPKLVPSNCDCVERPVGTMPKLCRLAKKKDYPSTSPKECIPICSITARADDSLDLYKKKCLPEIRDSDCLCVEPNFKDVKMCRLEKKQALSLSECKIPCTMPRADNLNLYEVEKRKLPSFPCSPCLCVEPDVPKTLPKIPKLIKRPLKPTDLPIVAACKVPCPTPRADEKVNLYIKKCLPEYDESSCKCIEPPRMKSVPLCKPKMISETAGLARVEEICEKPCEETADDVCKYEIKKKRLKPILPRQKSHTKSSSRGFQCFKPKKRYYSSQPFKLGKIIGDSDDEAEQEELVLKILRLIKLHSRNTYESSNTLLDVTGGGLSKKLSAITYDGKFKLVPSEKVPCSLRLDNKTPRPADLVNENSRPGGLYYEEYEALESMKTKNMQEILDEMLKRSKGSN